MKPLRSSSISRKTASYFLIWSPVSPERASGIATFFSTFPLPSWSQPTHQSCQRFVEARFAIMTS